jgi:SPP1 gp7 family putative phage head morphogenesis protein
MPNIYQTIQEFNRALDAQEKAQWLAMAKRWKQTEDTLALYIQRHADAIAARKLAGQAISEYAYTKLDTWKDLQRQIISEARRYENYATATIKAEQLSYLEMGASAAQAAISGELGAGYAFNRLNIQALENMVGITADGSPLFDVLQKRALTPDMVEGLVNKLNEAIALGYNPRKTAGMMAEGLAAGLDKALVIARTEQQRSYRAASQAQYVESGVVMQYQRHAAPSERSCIECIALDGKIYPTDADFESHPNCRCFMTPVIEGAKDPGAKTLTWFEGQSESVQREIMGAGRFELYQNGTPLEDFVRVTNDPTWGATISAVPLSELNK